MRTLGSIFVILSAYGIWLDRKQPQFFFSKNTFTPLPMGGRAKGGSCSPPPPLPWFLPFTQNINPYLKILELAKLSVADAPIKKIQKKMFTPIQIPLKYGSKNRQWFEGLMRKLFPSNRTTSCMYAETWTKCAILFSFLLT